MVSLRQLSKIKYRKKKKKKSNVPFFNGCPQKKAVCVRVFKMSPKKPNSAKRSVAKLRLLSSNKTIYSYIPGLGHNLQEYSVVLVRGSRVKDLPGIKTKVIRGCYDFQGELSRLRSRSKYGSSHPKKRLYIFMFSNFFTFCDSAHAWQLGFQDPASPVAEGIIKFHHDIMVILVFIVFFVGWMQFRSFYLFDHKRNPVPSTQVHGSTIEVIWTLIPALILMCIAVPSFSLLYAADEVNDPAITLKVIGSQWYWNYEYSDYLDSEGESIFFES
jgi:ribosomal protein S12